MILDFCYRNVYSIDKTFIPVKLGRFNNLNLCMPEIGNFEEMIAVARKLSEDFPFVRVDLYNIDGRTVFGELTWNPQEEGYTNTSAGI